MERLLATLKLVCLGAFHPYFCTKFVPWLCQLLGKEMFSFSVLGSDGGECRHGQAGRGTAVYTGGARFDAGYI